MRTVLLILCFLSPSLFAGEVVITITDTVTKKVKEIPLCVAITLHDAKNPDIEPCAEEVKTHRCKLNYHTKMLSTNTDKLYPSQTANCLAVEVRPGQMKEPQLELSFMVDEGCSAYDIPDTQHLSINDCHRFTLDYDNKFGFFFREN